MSHSVLPALTQLSQPAGAHTRRLRLLQATWLVYAGVVGALTIAGLPAFTNALHAACEGPACLSDFQLTLPNAQALQAAGISLAAYARYNLITRGLINPLVTFGLAGLLIWKKPGDRVAALFAFVLVAHGAQNAQGISTLAALYPGLGWASASIMFIQGAGFVPLYCLFPDGRWVPRWSKWVALAFVLVSFFGLVSPQAQSGALGAVVVGAAYAFVPAVQVYRYRKVATWTQRQQTKWVVFSWALFAVPILLTPVWLAWVPGVFEMGTPANLAINVYAFASIMFVHLAFVIAILRYRLFEIDLLINRALVYGVLTAGVVGCYLALVAGFGAVFQSQAGLLVSLLASGLIALLFQPAHQHVQRGVNRLLYGERDEPYRVLTRLGQRLEAAVDPATALPLTMQTVAQALKLRYAAISLKHESGYQTVAAHGVAPTEPERFPLIYAGAVIGELLVATRAPGEPLTPADQRLLGDLARQIGVTAHAWLLAADLDRARLRLVTAREETRRRLGSDLHDGVGHQLAGLVQRAEMAANLVDHDPPAARALLAEVAQRLNAAIGQVRDLAHQLHPPELELRGLAGALRERADTQSGLVVRVDALDPWPQLPSAIETAAYYIALEALANVERHAGARSCLLRLALVSGNTALLPATLELDITDDGHGPSPDAASGLGLLSMQARAVEVGGTCRTERISQGGMRVSVRLPCPAQLE